MCIPQIFTWMLFVSFNVDYEVNPVTKYELETLM